MDDWLLDLIRGDKEKGEKPDAGEGTITHFTDMDGVGLIDLAGGETVAFADLSDEREPEPGLEVHAREIYWDEQLGWVAEEVESLESFRAADPEPEPSPSQTERTPPPPDFPDLGEVRHQIDQITDLQASYGAAEKPAIFMKPVTDGASTRSRFQARPLVPEGVEWPASPEGPMRFLGQIDFAELSAASDGTLEAFPEQGVLALFCHSEFWVNYDDEAYWSLHFTPEPGDARELSPPADPDLPAVGVEFERYPTLPHPFDRTFRPEPPADATADALDDRVWGFFEDWVPSPSHQIGGHPGWIQADARRAAAAQTEGTEPTDWEVMWVVDSDPQTHGDLFFGDLGRFYLMIRRDDLADANFERVRAFVQSY